MIGDHGSGNTEQEGPCRARQGGPPPNPIALMHGRASHGAFKKMNGKHAGHDHNMDCTAALPSYAWMKEMNNNQFVVENT